MSDPDPPGWGEDKLTEFLTTAFHNRKATYHHCRDAIGKVIQIDALFMRIERDWTDPENEIPPLLAIRAHSLFRSACEHAMATQLVETFPLLRACLEHAAMALYLNQEPAQIEPWANRHASPDARKTARKAASPEKILAAVKSADASAAQLYERLYELAIDQGASE